MGFRYLFIAILSLAFVFPAWAIQFPALKYTPKKKKSVHYHRNLYRHPPKAPVFYKKVRKGDTIVVTYKSVTAKTLPLARPVLIPTINKRVEPVVKYGSGSLRGGRESNNYGVRIPYLGFWIGVRW